MSSTNQTNVPKLEFQNSGITLPEESEILNGVIQDFQNAFQNKLKFYNSNNEFLLSTPQGQLVTSIAAIISDRNRLLAHYVNQVDPNYAIGRMQDAIGRIYFIERKQATYTTVRAKCSGKEGTIIPAGTLVKDIQGNIYRSLDENAVMINQEVDAYDKNNQPIKVIESFIDVNFECTEKGEIPCPAGTLTERYEVIEGWESVTNKYDGIIGGENESQAQFEQRRRQSVAHNSLNSVDSIMANLLMMDEVEDAYVTENYEGIEKKITNDLVIKPHSIYVCVYQKKQQTTNSEPITLNEQSNIELKIAKTIWRKKTPGCALNGSISVEVADDTVDANGKALYAPSAVPTYLINFDFAQEIPIYISVKLSKPKPIVGDPTVLVKNKIYSVFTEQNGVNKPRMGSQILASQFYCAVQSLGDWVKIINLKIGLSANPTEDMIKVAINQMPTLDIDNIDVVFDPKISEVFPEAHGASYE
ncbi:baseplate J/gp47 family protein [Commensalibacter nepenthis]|uniref:Baseplate J/gp47 family protein n=1 Tax=Commensalibacter nepenthis TaxID=3043872 RepID=A0ABT6Q6V5_9PROT|nr:baseplate J/gp47 family protein [Commensalibacter sp. TBRC 10068]MDI2112080.1 baseplate J/gp47 family protein [Commensalibacter sp. TBRC 10068]